MGNVENWEWRGIGGKVTVDFNVIRRVEICMIDADPKNKGYGPKGLNALREKYRGYEFVATNVVENAYDFWAAMKKKGLIDKIENW